MRRMILSGAVAVALFTLFAAVHAQQAPSAAARPAAKTAEAVKLTPDAEAVLELDRQAEQALNRRDVDYLSKKVFAEDMIFTHGDKWTNSNSVGTTNTRDVWLKSITTSNYSEKHANLQRIEMHGDVALVEGRSSGKNAGKPYEIWYLRVYNKRAGEWRLISHKTVRGPQDQTVPE